LGKQKKVSFVKSGNTRKLQRLELVHTDVYGPTSVATIGGSRYYVTFIDDNSKKVWVYFLKNKSEVFNIFKKWKVTMENETNLRVKFLKSDMVESIVAESSLRKEVSLAQFRVFGCDSYIKVKDVARDKLDAKSMKCTFICYVSDEMGYRFWDSKGHKSLGGSLDTSEGFENSESFEDSERSDEEDSKDKASSEEGGSKTPHPCDLCLLLMLKVREFKNCDPLKDVSLLLSL
ncbi:retrovirus-related pol polyprotein from transposon TNT 1-94, partial [Tanacetum coccineum]